MKMTIKITEEIIKQSAVTNTSNHARECMVARAINSLHPAQVGVSAIIWDGCTTMSVLPDEATRAIQLYDSFTPLQRLGIQPFSFEIDFPDELVDKIGLQEVHKILHESTTLELVG